MLTILGPVPSSGSALSLVPVDELLEQLLVHSGSIGGIDGRRMRPHVGIHSRGPLALGLGLGGSMGLRMSRSVDGLGYSMVRCDSPLAVGAEGHSGSARSAHGRRWYHTEGGVRRRDCGVHQGLRGARKQMLGMGHESLLGLRLGMRPSARRSLARGRRLRRVDSSNRRYRLCICRSDVG